MYRIKQWDSHENNRSREIKDLRWLAFPNKQDGDGYLTLLDHPRGPSHYGCFVAIALLASKSPERGVLLKTSGTPHTPETIARKTHMPLCLVLETLERCMGREIDWIEFVPTEKDQASLFQPAVERRAARQPDDAPVTESESGGRATCAAAGPRSDERGRTACECAG